MREQKCALEAMLLGEIASIMRVRRFFAPVLLLAFDVLAPSMASAGGLGSLLGSSPPPRSQSVDALRTTPRLDPNIPDSRLAAHPTTPAASPTLAIPGTNGKAALGVEPPPPTNPGGRIILAPSTITTPPRNTRGQSGNVPAFSITIPSN